MKPRKLTALLLALAAAVSCCCLRSVTAFQRANLPNRQQKTPAAYSNLFSAQKREPKLVIKPVTIQRWHIQVRASTSTTARQSSSNSNSQSNNAAKQANIFQTLQQIYRKTSKSVLQWCQQPFSEWQQWLMVLIYYFFHLMVLSQHSILFGWQLIPNDKGHFCSVGWDSVAGMISLAVFYKQKRKATFFQRPWRRLFLDFPDDKIPPDVAAVLNATKSIDTDVLNTDKDEEEQSQRSNLDDVVTKVLQKAPRKVLLQRSSNIKSPPPIQIEIPSKPQTTGSSNDSSISEPPTSSKDISPIIEANTTITDITTLSTTDITTTPTTTTTTATNMSTAMIATTATDSQNNSKAISSSSRLDVNINASVNNSAIANPFNKTSKQSISSSGTTNTSLLGASSDENASNSSSSSLSSLKHEQQSTTHNAIQTNATHNIGSDKQRVTVTHANGLGAENDVSNNNNTTKAPLAETTTLLKPASTSLKLERTAISSEFRNQTQTKRDHVQEATSTAVGESKEDDAASSSPNNNKTASQQPFSMEAIAEGLSAFQEQLQKFVSFPSPAETYGSENNVTRIEKQGGVDISALSLPSRKERRYMLTKGSSFLATIFLVQTYFATGRFSFFWEDTLYAMAGLGFPLTMAMHRSLCVLLGHLTWVAFGSFILGLVPRPSFFGRNNKWYRQNALIDQSESIVEDTMSTGVARKKLSRKKKNWMWWVIGGYSVSAWFFNIADFTNLYTLPQQVLEDAIIQEGVVTQLINPENNDFLASLVGYIAPCLSAPWWEEILYRGFFFPALSLYLPVWASVLISGIIFSAHHLSLTAALPLAVLGWTWSGLYMASDNLWTTIVVHALWNSRVFLSSWLGV